MDRRPHLNRKLRFTAEKNGRILLANLVQSSRSTFSCVSFPSFFAFQEGMWGTQISALLSSPTVSGRLATQYVWSKRADISPSIQSKCALSVGFLPYLNPLGVTLCPACGFPSYAGTRIHHHIRCCWIRGYAEP